MSLLNFRACFPLTQLKLFAIPVGLVLSRFSSLRKSLIAPCQTSEPEAVLLSPSFFLRGFQGQL